MVFYFGKVPYDVSIIVFVGVEGCDAWDVFDTLTCDSVGCSVVVVVIVVLSYRRRWVRYRFCNGASCDNDANLSLSSLSSFRRGESGVDGVRSHSGSI